MLELRITSDAVRFLKKQGKEFTVKLKPVGAGCCIDMVPTVKMGKPENIKKYHMISKDDLDFYFWEELSIPTGKATISLKGHIMFKAIKIDGVEENY